MLAAQYQGQVQGHSSAQDVGAASEGRDEGVGGEEEDAEEDGDDDFYDPNEDVALPSIMGQDDPRRMKLTNEERYWAMEIKDAVEAIPELDNLSHFMYAQLALICKEDVEDAIQRAHALQIFRQEYNLLDTYEDSRRAIRALVDHFPGHFLSFGFSQEDSTYVMVRDLSKLNMGSGPPSKKVQALFAGSYYLYHAFFPDMASIYKGGIVLLECADVDWTNKPDYKVLQQLFREFLSVYPFTGSARYYHTGTFVNLMTSTLRRLLPEVFKDKLRTGLTVEGNLNALYMVPNEDIATQRMILRLEGTLKQRYENEASFSLFEKGCFPFFPTHREV